MAAKDSESVVWLTQEAYDRLALELEELTTQRTQGYFSQD